MIPGFIFDTECQTNNYLLSVWDTNVKKNQYQLSLKSLEFIQESWSSLRKVFCKNGVILKIGILGHRMMLALRFTYEMPD